LALANNGTCPITGERILKPEAVTNVLSLMYSCGMSIYSGQFAFQVKKKFSLEYKETMVKKW
jgi:glutaminase